MSFVIEVTQDRAACFALRFKVFVEEQGVPVEDEIDIMDEVAVHMLASINGKPVGTARVLFEGDTAKIGRVCVVPEGRGTGLGAALIQEGVAIARRQAGVHKVKLGAQIQALGFYEKLGFSAFGPTYLDAGIEHRDMGLSLV